MPGAATVAAATVMAAAGLPLEFVAATIPIGVIADMARTATNVTAAAVSATVVARQTGLLDDEIFDGRGRVRRRGRPARRSRRRSCPHLAGSRASYPLSPDQSQELVGVR